MENERTSDPVPAGGPEPLVVRVRGTAGVAIATAMLCALRPPAPTAEVNGDSHRPPGPKA